MLLASVNQFLLSINKIVGIQTKATALHHSWNSNRTNKHKLYCYRSQNAHWEPLADWNTLSCFLYFVIPVSWDLV